MRLLWVKVGGLWPINAGGCSRPRGPQDGREPRVWPPVNRQESARLRRPTRPSESANA